MMPGLFFGESVSPSFVTSPPLVPPPAIVLSWTPTIPPPVDSTLLMATVPAAVLVSVCPIKFRAWLKINVLAEATSAKGWVLAECPRPKLADPQFLPPGVVVVGRVRQDCLVHPAMVLLIRSMAPSTCLASAGCPALGACCAQPDDTTAALATRLSRVASVIGQAPQTKTSLVA